MDNHYLARQPGKVKYEDRCQRYRQEGLILWFTGLSGAGKTTIALELEKILFESGKIVYHLDGDDLRGGLNAGLGFSMADRQENIRRAAEVARLFQEAGLIVLATFISPTRAMRQVARSRARPGTFIEIYVRASLETCRSRDPKGFYRRAAAGEIKDYTGIASDYEEPLAPELVLDTDKEDVDACIRLILKKLEDYDIFLTEKQDGSTGQTGK
jgi:adenylyl-sulfate kinase